MNYIAKKGYVHRDLAARNVLLYLPETFIESQNLEILENLNVPIGRVRKLSWKAFCFWVMNWIWVILFDWLRKVWTRVSQNKRLWNDSKNGVTWSVHQFRNYFDIISLGCLPAMVSGPAWKLCENILCQPLYLLMFGLVKQTVFLSSGWRQSPFGPTIVCNKTDGTIPWNQMSGHLVLLFGKFWPMGSSQIFKGIPRLHARREIHFKINMNC